MLRVATVLSAREWEARFVSEARDSAAVKLVLRAYLPDEVASHADSIDVVIAGAETPWVTPTRVAAWRRLGLRVVGVHPRLDAPAADRLTAGGADLVFEDDLDCEQMVREIRLLEATIPESETVRERVIAVTGTRGGPGRTEVATALAWAAAGLGESVLLDADLAGPSVAVRLGLSPRPDVADCIDASLGGGDVGAKAQRVGRLKVVPGPLRATGVRLDAVVDVAEALAVDATVVIDTGPWTEASAVVRAADVVVFVVDATPVGIVRVSRIVDSWPGPPPLLVLNKVRPGRRIDVTIAVRRWSGLEPAAVVPFSRPIHAAAARGCAPHRRMLGAVAHMITVAS